MPEPTDATPTDHPTTRDDTTPAQKTSRPRRAFTVGVVTGIVSMLALGGAFAAGLYAGRGHDDRTADRHHALSHPRDHSTEHSRRAHEDLPESFSENASGHADATGQAAAAALREMLDELGPYDALDRLARMLDALPDNARQRVIDALGAGTHQ